MKTLRDYIDLVDQKFNQALSEKADPTKPASMKNINGMNVFTNDPAPAAPAAAPAGAPNPWEGKDPAKAAAWKALSPEDQKWLGGADPTDTIILARAPNKGAPAAAAPAQAAQAAQPVAPAPSQAVDPDSQQGQMLAAQTAGMNDPASGVAGVTGGSQQDNMLAAQTAGMDSPAPAQAAQAAPAAKPKVMAKSDPAVLKLQQDLIAKGAKIKADGVMGPATKAAQTQFGGAGAGRGGQGGPTAAQAATAPAPAQAAQATPAPYNAAKDSQAANVAKESRTARNDHKFIDELNAMRSIAGLPTKNKW